MLLLAFLLCVGYCKYALAYKITVKFCHQKCRGITAYAERQVGVSIKKERGETILLFPNIERNYNTLIRRKKIVNLCFKKRRE